MQYSRRPSRTLRIAAVLALVSTTFARPNSLFERIELCAPDFEQCSQSGLPGNFCCATGTTCNVLAGNTTVLCCPDGGDCTTIRTINCAVSLQDPSKNPKAAVKTTELDKKLPVCGGACCPFGYHCDEDGANCIMDEDQSIKPGEGSSSAPSTTSTIANPSPTTSNGASTTADATTSAAAGGTNAEITQVTPAPSTDVPLPTTSSAPNTAAIAGGVIGGLVALALIIAAAVFVLRRRRRENNVEREKRDSDTSFGNIISAPIPHADYATERLDFLAKIQAGSSASSSPQLTTKQQKQNNFLPPRSPYSAFGSFRPDSTMSTDATLNADSKQNAGRRSHHLSAEVGGLRNLTSRYTASHYSVPERGRYSIPNPFSSARSDRQTMMGDGESINVFADPAAVSPSIYTRRDTTWTDFQVQAGRPGTSGTDQPPLPERRW